MSSRPMQLAPVGAVLAFAGWCAWCVDGEPETPRGKALPSLDIKGLAGLAGPVPPADPFGLRPGKPKHGSPAGGPGVGAAAAGGARGAPAAPGKAKAKASRAAGLTLSATTLGAERLAVINGKIYAEGDRVAGKEGWVVERIDEGKALLRLGAERAELAFASRRVAKPGPAAVPGRKTR